MKFKFQKDLDYQLEAINSVVEIFDTGKNLKKGIENGFELVSPNDLQVIANEMEINEESILEKIKALQEGKGICEFKKDSGGKDILDDEGNKKVEKYFIDEENARDISIEMETGTGKTYVYLRTIFELNKKYNLKKFIILVPSVAIREGVLKSIEQMREHFKSLYEVNFKGFAYDSDKLNEVRDFVQGNVLQIMIMTIQSFDNDSKIMKKSLDRFNGDKPIDLVSATNPVIIMDEPQNMESDLAKEAIKDLKPIFKLRYSATHKNIYNLIYRLTPIDSYKKNLVKKIEIYGIKEENSNDLLLKVKEIITEKGSGPKARVILSVKNADNTYTDKEILIKAGDDLFRKTKNDFYKDLIVFDVNAREKRVELSDGKFYKLEEDGENKEDIFRVQIRETIKLHLDKQNKLKKHDIKVLSLFFIDKVDNYIHNDSLIRKIFNEEFNKLKNNYEDFKTLEAENVHKGYFASKKVRGQTEYVDSREKSTEADKEAFDLIMKDKERLLSFNEKVSFIFSHSALKEGWDNPNIFQICTLRETNSIMKKRQEVGRGLRLPVNQDGVRIYDDKINILTVVPNESYKDFCATYQAEMSEAGYKAVDPGNAKEKISIKTTKYLDSEDFKELWNRINRKTKYILEINSNLLIKNVLEKINELDLSRPIIKIEKAKIYFDNKNNLQTSENEESFGGIIKYNIKINNFIDRIAKETELTKNTIFSIFEEAENIDFIFDNYEDYIRNIILIIQNEKQNLLISEGIKYEPIQDYWEAKLLYGDLGEVLKNKSIESDKSPTDRIVFDSEGEREFAEHLIDDSRVKVFTKLPRGFVVKTPFGDYVPDWAIVFTKNNEEKLYLVRETKFYEGKNLEDFLSKEELNKIECAKKHFKAINTNADYKVVQGKDLVDLV